MKARDAGVRPMVSLPTLTSIAPSYAATEGGYVHSIPDRLGPAPGHLQCTQAIEQMLNARWGPGLFF
jgi:hypothetical protein